jgi:hypothetical protein
MSEIVAEVATAAPPHAGASETSGSALGSAPVSYADEELEVFSEDGSRAGGPAAIPQVPGSGLHMAAATASSKTTVEDLSFAPTPPAAPAGAPVAAFRVVELPPTAVEREGTDGAQPDEAAAAAAFGLTSAEATELGGAAAPGADAAAASLPPEGDFGIAYRRVAVPGQPAAAGEGQAGYRLPQQQGFQGEAQLVAAAQQNAQLQQWIGHSMATAAGHGGAGAAAGVQAATGAADGVDGGADGDGVDDEFAYDVDGPGASQPASGGVPSGDSAGEAAAAAPAVDMEATLARLRAVDAACRTAAANAVNADAAASVAGAPQPPAPASAAQGGQLHSSGSSDVSATGALAGGVSALAAVRAQLQSAAAAEERDRVKELEQRVMASSEVVGSGASSAAPSPAAAGGAAAGSSISGAAAGAAGKGQHLAALAEDNEDEDDEDDTDEEGAAAAVGTGVVRGEAAAGAPATAGSAAELAAEAASSADGFPAPALSAAAPIPVALATPPAPRATSGAVAAGVAVAAPPPAGALATNPLMARRQPAPTVGTAATPESVLPPMLPGTGLRAAAGAADASEGTPQTAAIGVAESPVPAAGGGVGLAARSAAAPGAARPVDYPTLASHLLTPRRFFAHLPKVQASAKDPTAGCLGALFAQPLLPVLHPERAAVFALALTPYNPEDDAHYRAFPALYEGLTGTPFGRSGGNASWTDIGFQREADFSSDLRGAGMLGPLQALWLLHHYPGFARKLQAAAASPRHSFPLMIQSISLTAKAMQALRWGKLNKLCNRERQSVPVSVTFMVADVDAAPSQRPGPVFAVFNQFYGALMFTFYTLWMERGATMGQIGTLVNEVVERCYRDPAGCISHFLEGVGRVKGHEHYDGDVGAAGFDLEAGAGRQAAGSVGSAGAGAGNAAAAPASSTKGKQAAPLKLTSPLFDGPAEGKAVGAGGAGSVGGRANRYAT